MTPAPSPATTATPSPTPVAESPSSSPTHPAEQLRVARLKAKGRRLTFIASAAGEVRIRVLLCVRLTRKHKCPDRIHVRSLRRQVRPGRARIDLGKLKRGVYLITVDAATRAATSTRVR